MIFSVVVVIYKKSYEDSVALMSLLGALGDIEMAGFECKLYVWNNSPGFSAPLLHESVVWLEGENVALPVIYNSVADMAFSAGSDVLMLSDDDTDYSQYDFKRNLDVVRMALLNEGGQATVGCFIPQIVSGGRLVSPGGRNLFKGYLLKRVTSGLRNSKNLLAINSATMLTKACYARMRPIYDERLNFYGTDTDFFVRYERFFDKVYVLDSVVDHSLSEHSVESLGRALFRWNDHIYALSVTFSEKRFFFRFLLFMYVIYLRVKLAFKYRSFLFLRLG